MPAPHRQAHFGSRGQTRRLVDRHSRLAKLLLLAGLVSSLTAATPAVAEPISATEDTVAKAQAQALLTEGNQLARKGDFAAALKRYRAAHELYPSPKLLLNIGTSLRHLGRDAEAATVYEQYLAHPQAEAQTAPTVKALLRELEQLVARITIVLNVADARVSVDGRLLPERARRTTVRVDPGEHTIVAEMEGRQPAVSSVRVGAAQHRAVTLTLVAPGPPADDGSTQRIVAYSMGGLALAGVAVGAIFGGLFLSSKSVADDHCDALRCDPEGADAVDEAQGRGMVANIAFIASGVVAAAAVVVYFTAPSVPEDEPGLTATLRASGPGLRLDLRW